MEIYYQNNPLHDLSFPFLPLKSIQNYSFGLLHSVQETSLIFCDIRHKLTTEQVTLTSLAYSLAANHHDC